MPDDNCTLREVFEGLSKRDFVFVCPGGNWGDHLIWLGAEHLARQVSVRWKTVEFEDLPKTTFSPEQVIYIHGGGGFNSWCSGRALRAFLQLAQSHRGTLIMGPETCSTETDFLRSALAPLENTQPGEIFLFARERTSRDMFRKVAPKKFHVHLDNDTALHLTREVLLQGIGEMARSYDLLAWREDPEASGEAAPARKGVRLDPAYFARNFAHWVRMHAAARSIYTNRLHCSIAGMILGVPTTLGAGNYHKNRSVWEFSLKQRGVQWCEASGDQPSAHPLISFNLLPARLRESYKLRNFWYWMHGVPLS